MRVHLIRRGSIWWLLYREHGRRFRYSLNTENKKIAEDLRAEVERKLRRGESAAEPARISVREFLETYRAFSLSRKRPKSHATDMARIEAFLANVKVTEIRDVTTADVSHYLAQKVIQDSVVPTTILRIREALHAFFNHARRLKYIHENPVSNVPRPRVPERDPRFLSIDQIDELLNSIKDDLIYPLIATAVYAGLRREELCWLTWDDLNLGNAPPVLRVREKVINGEYWLPKTKRNRTIPISTKLLDILKNIRGNCVPWVFPSPEGCRWDSDNLGHRFQKLMKRARLPWNFLSLRLDRT